MYIMIKQMLISLSVFSGFSLYGQPSSFSGGWSGSTITVDFSKLKSSGGNSSGEKYTSARESSPVISSGESQKIAYNRFAADAFKKAVEAWKKRDWDAVIRHCNTAHVYNPDNSDYVKTREDAKGYREWDKGVEESDRGNHDKAIDRFSIALRFFPDHPTLKSNIVICSRNKTADQAEKAYKAKNWVDAAVYYNVLWKNFGNNNETVQNRYAECLTKMEGMKQAEKAHIRFDAKLAEVKASLQARNINW